MLLLRCSDSMCKYPNFVNTLYTLSIKKAEHSAFFYLTKEPILGLYGIPRLSNILRPCPPIFR